MENCILDIAKSKLGESYPRGLYVEKEIWWWTDQIQEATTAKKEAFKKWQQSKDDNNNNNIFILYSAKSMCSSKRFTIKSDDIVS